MSCMACGNGDMCRCAERIPFSLLKRLKSTLCPSLFAVCTTISSVLIVISAATYIWRWFNTVDGDNLNIHRSDHEHLEEI
jgi:hypothetical protein